MSARAVWLNALYLLIVVLLSGVLCFGQESRATIIGRVTDPSGALVAGARVQAVNVATNTNGTSVTNESGNFEIPYLLPGVYRVSVESAGFKTAVREQIQLRVSDRVAIDFALDLGAVGESVTVSGATPLLATTTASAGMVMEQRVVQELMISPGGNPYFFTKLAVGVLNSGNYGGGGPQSLNDSTQIIVNGTTNMTETSLDGSPNMAQRGQVFSPPRDLVQEFKIQTATYDASLGHAAGAVSNVSTKSGTNELHGTVYYQDSRWTAVPWFTNNYVYNPATGPINSLDKQRMLTPSFSQGIWGATATGPVILPKLYDGRNRTFWSFGWERLNNINWNATSYTVPTAAEMQGDFSKLLAIGSNYQLYDPLTTVPAAQAGRLQRQPIPGNVIAKSRLDPIAQKILSYYPAPNQAGTIDDQQNYFLSVPTEYWNRSLINRIDHVISDKQRFFVRWANAQYNQTGGTLPTPVTQTLVDRPAWGLLLDDVYIFNPQLLLDVRYNVNYQNPRNYRGSQGFDLTTLGFPQSLVNTIKNQNDPRGLTFPQVQIDGSAYTDLGTNGGDTTKNIYHNFAATLTKITGEHSLKFGWEYRVMQDNGFNYGNVAPQLVFAQAYTRGPLDNSPTAPIGQGLASMLLGIPTGGQVSTNASRAEESTFWAGYIQDDWRITRKLTVNLGLRYEYEGPTTERYNRSIRGFDFRAQSPIAAQAAANYARNPIPELPVSQFKVMGGLNFAGVNGQPRALWNGDKNNFAPRVGIAYQLNAKTVLRAGYGIFYDMLGVDRQDVNQGGFNQSTNLIPSTDNGQTFQARLSNPFPTGLQAPPGASGGLSTFLGRAASFFNPNAVNPYMQRWSFSVQRELPGRVLLDTSYVGNRGTKLGVSREFTPTPAQYLSRLPVRDQATIDYLSALVPNPFFGIPDFVGTGLGSQTISRGNLLKPYPEFSNITSTVPTGYSWYHSLQVAVEKRMGSGLTFQTAWTWSKYMDATSYRNATDPRPEEVISASDYPHRLTVNGMYELPFGRGRHFLSGLKGIPNGILGGWQFQGLYEAQSGQALGFGNAIFNGDVHNITLPVDERKVSRWFNTNAGFERNSARVLGSNIQGLSTRFSDVRRDGINNFQLSTYKNFRIKEHYTVRFMFFAINALNHAQFGPPNTAPTNSAFGTVTTIRGPARQLVTSLRLLF
jgi:hypothetical protein